MDKSAPPPYSPPGVGSSGFAPNPGYPPPQHDFGPQLPPPPPPPRPIQYPPHVTENTVIITNGPIVYRSFGPDSQLITCPHCRQMVTTKVASETSTKTHLFALILCLFGCWPCCLLPYCMESCQNKLHFCPNCNAYLGAYDD